MPACIRMCDAESPLPTILQLFCFPGVRLFNSGWENAEKETENSESFGHRTNSTSGTSSKALTLLTKEGCGAFRIILSHWFNSSSQERVFWGGEEVSCPSLGFFYQTPWTNILRNVRNRAQGLDSYLMPKSIPSYLCHQRIPWPLLFSRYSPCSQHGAAWLSLAFQSFHGSINVPLSSQVSPNQLATNWEEGDNSPTLPLVTHCETFFTLTLTGYTSLEMEK